jgi:uncharacterized membrane protein YecN with MAPEG domain
MDLPSVLSISPIYAALLGLFFVPITLRVGAYRVKNKIDLGDGGDAQLLRIMRAQANFAETVPLLVVLLVLMELAGASSVWLHSVGGLLVAGRALHYIGLSGLGPFAGRPIGIMATLISYLAASGWLLYHFL